MRYKGYAPSEAFLPSSQGGRGIRVHQKLKTSAENNVQHLGKMGACSMATVQASRTGQTSKILICQTTYPSFWQK